MGIGKERMMGREDEKGRRTGEEGGKEQRIWEEEEK